MNSRNYRAFNCKDPYQNILQLGTDLGIPRGLNAQPMSDGSTRIIVNLDEVRADKRLDIDKLDLYAEEKGWFKESPTA